MEDAFEKSFVAQASSSNEPAICKKISEKTNSVTVKSLHSRKDFRSSNDCCSGPYFNAENPAKDKINEEFGNPFKQSLNFKITTIGNERKVEAPSDILKETFGNNASGCNYLSSNTSAITDETSFLDRIRDMTDSHFGRDSTNEGSSVITRKSNEKFHSDRLVKKKSFPVGKLSQGGKRDWYPSTSVRNDSYLSVVDKKESFGHTIVEKVKGKGGAGRGFVNTRLRDWCGTALNAQTERESSANKFDQRVSSELCIREVGRGRGMLKKIIINQNVQGTKSDYKLKSNCESCLQGVSSHNVSPLLDDEFSDPSFEEVQSKSGVLHTGLLKETSSKPSGQIIQSKDSRSEECCRFSENEQDSQEEQNPIPTFSQDAKLLASSEELKTKQEEEQIASQTTSAQAILDEDPVTSDQPEQAISEGGLNKTVHPSKQAILGVEIIQSNTQSKRVTFAPLEIRNVSGDTVNVSKESTDLSLKERSEWNDLPSLVKRDYDVDNYTNFKSERPIENLHSSKEAVQATRAECVSLPLQQKNNSHLNDINVSDEETTSCSAHWCKSKPPSSMGSGMLSTLYSNVMQKEEEVALQSNRIDVSAATPEDETESQCSFTNENCKVTSSELSPDKEGNVQVQKNELIDEDIILLPSEKKNEDQENNDCSENLLNNSVNSTSSAGPSESIHDISANGTTSASDLNRDSDESFDSFRVQSINSFREDMLSKIHSTGSIIHGDIQISLVSKIYDFNFHNLIVKNLQYRKIIDLARSQMLSFPIVANERNLVLIGPLRTKKTSGWLIPVLNSLLNDKRDEPLNSPKCIILAPGSHRVRHIARLCSAYVGAKLITIATHGGGLELERKDELLSGVDILISTPRCCLRLFQCKYIIIPNRLRYFILDSAEDMLKMFSPEITLFKNGLDNLTKMRELFAEDSRLQIIVAGTMWTEQIEDFALKWMKNPVICITSYLEAAIYSLVNFKLNITTSEEKIAILIEMISTKPCVRTVVICCSTEESKQLRTKLQTLVCRTVMVAHEGIHHTLIPEIRRTWPLEEAPILICTDGVLQEMDMSNAKWLIHYSLPNNKTDFRERFRFIKDSFMDRVKTDSKERPNCEVDIFIDENSKRFLPKILEMMNRLNLAISEDLLNQAQEIDKLKEIEKCNVKFCENILQFGQCWKSYCKMRHLIIPSKDVSQLETPIKSFVTLNILDVISPTHLIGRIISYSQKLFSEETLLHSKFLQITLQLAEFYADNANRCVHGRPMIGDVVAIQRDENFARGKIIDIIERDSKCTANKVNVYLLDWGTYITEEVEKILSLPLDLQVLPGEAVNIYITGLLPLDLDRCWSYTATKFIKEKVMEYQNDDYRDVTIVGQVELIIGRDLLLDKLLFYEEPPEGCPPWLIESFRQLIISANFGIYNPKHKDILKKLAWETGISVAEEVVKKEERVVVAQPNYEVNRWAFLTKDCDHLVYVIVAEDIDVFFVRLIKFQSCLDELEKDLKSALLKEMIMLDEFNVGTICAVLDTGREIFIRGMIIEPLELIDVLTEVEVRFLDYGERLVFRKSEVCKLPQGFVNRLPFQAIECGLAGIKTESGEERTKEALNSFDDLTTTGDNLSSLSLKVIEIKKVAQTIGDSHYNVVLINTDGEQDVIINEEIVSLGLAEWEEDMKEIVLDVRKQQLAQKLKAETANSEDEFPENQNCSNTAVAKLPPNNVESNIFIFDGEQIDLDQFEFVGDYEEFLPSFFSKFIKPPPAVEIKDITEPEPKEESSEFNVSNESDELLQANDNMYNTECFLQRANIFSPTVHWRQSTNYVWIKILLPDVKSFKMEWTMCYINFQTTQEDRLYFVDVDLFGPINPDTVMHKMTGLYFEIRLSKLLTGHYWPRLFYTNIKPRGILHDPDKVALQEDEYEKEDKSLIPSYVARSETSESEGRESVKQIISKLPTKFNHNALEEDGSASSEESDIDVFSPIPDALDNVFDD